MIYIYIYIHTHTHTYAYTMYVCIYIYIYIHTLYSHIRQDAGVASSLALQRFMYANIIITYMLLKHVSHSVNE